MKGLSRFNTFVFISNLAVALLLFIASVTSIVAIEKVPFVFFLNLMVPFLVILNLLFSAYWAVQRKWQFSVSFIILMLGYFLLGTFYEFRAPHTKMSADELKVMTFNVRGFNRTGQLKKPNVFEDILQLINHEDPDIICFQEFGYFARKKLDQYPYRNLKYHEDKSLMGIFSKYPIIDSGYLDFKKSANDAEFADILYKGDTLRIYNIHLESLRLPHHAMQISDELSEGLYARLSRSFELQRGQANQFREHKSKSSLRTLVCGDFNNTQFSNVYQVIKGDMQDSFIEKGSGFGRTYQFLRFPLRIDFILADSSFEIMAHKNFNERLSDHYPVMASFKLKTD